MSRFLKLATAVLFVTSVVGCTASPTSPSVDISSLDLLDPDKPVPVEADVQPVVGPRSATEASLTPSDQGPNDLAAPGAHQASGNKRPPYSVR